MGIADLYSDLLLQSQSFPETKNLIKSYLAAKNLMNNWAYSQRRQASIFDLHIRQYFSYLDKEYQSIKELYTNYENQKKEYLNLKDKLTKKKELIYLLTIKLYQL
jgi:predicted AlkP superfamily phosphohydrolase/phosphomutase